MIKTTAYNLATCRGAIDAVTEHVERLRLNLRAVEGEMVRRGHPKPLVERGPDEPNHRCNRDGTTVLW
jgi:hypothetical protein